MSKLLAFANPSVLLRPSVRTTRNSAHLRTGLPKPTSTSQRGAASIVCRRSNNSRSTTASRTGWNSFAGGTDGRRTSRVGEVIRREIGAIIADVCYNDAEVNGVMISVVSVKMSSDLRNARVHVSAFGTGSAMGIADGERAEKEEESKMKMILDMLKRNQKEIRFKLAQSVHLKYMPQLSFHKSEMIQATKTVSYTHLTLPTILLV